MHVILEKESDIHSISNFSMPGCFLTEIETNEGEAEATQPPNNIKEAAISNLKGADRTQRTITCH
jgi:hypothetical protein